MTKVFTDLTEWRQFRKNLITHSLGFVPTMGNLHVGHGSLLQHSTNENQHTLLSIFVNPTQFNNSNDLKNYPRTLATDINYAKKLNVDFILVPEYKMLYPDNYHYQVIETHLSQILEGQYRPQHFTGMLTIVLKLLLLAQAEHAYFGEKDFQQLQLVRGLTEAFFINTKIIGCPTVREPSGLALSSRNQRLTPQQKKLATKLHLILKNSNRCETAHQELIKQGFKVDYVEEYQQRRLAAVWLDDVRLIDNIPIPFQNMKC